MNRTISCLCIGALLALAAIGCSDVPKQKLEEVQSLLGRARTSEADRYAPEIFFEAEAALDAARLELDAQTERFWLSRSYGETNRLLDQARSLAMEAEETALVERDHARESAREAITEAQNALSQAETALEKAPGGKGAASDIAAMRSEIESARSSLDEADAAFARGDFVSARAHAEAIRARGMSIVAEIDVARKKTT